MLTDLEGEFFISADVLLARALVDVTGVFLKGDFGVLLGEHFVGDSLDERAGLELFLRDCLVGVDGRLGGTYSLREVASASLAPFVIKVVAVGPSRTPMGRFAANEFIICSERRPVPVIALNFAESRSAK